MRRATTFRDKSGRFHRMYSAGRCRCRAHLLLLRWRLSGQRFPSGRGSCMQCVPETGLRRVRPASVLPTRRCRILRVLFDTIAGHTSLKRSQVKFTVVYQIKAHPEKVESFLQSGAGIGQYTDFVLFSFYERSELCKKCLITFCFV